MPLICEYRWQFHHDKPPVVKHWSSDGEHHHSATEPGSYAPLARLDQAEGQEQKVYYFHTDQIGTPLEMSNSEGEIVWQATYRSWGAIESLAVNEIEQNLRFQGQYFDYDTGLHYNTLRYYDPEVGKFLTQDPSGLYGGLNLYEYTVNPFIWVDPLGLCADTVKWGNHLRSIGGGDPSKGMVRPHAHHIVFKNGKGKEMRAILDKSKEILERHDIDW